ncbi:MAG: electron transport complex subunit RsxG [Kangiellaceae bacterium]|jgi:electron transport complex protein RnfG|nr:electron transport complex subunit RsxG [Kangiellaceae bacterium]
MILQSMTKNSLILGAFALLSVGLIAIFNAATKSTIESEMQAKMARTLNDIVPSSQYNNDVYHDCKILTGVDSLLGTSESKVYRMRYNNNPIAAVFTAVAPNGYSGKIELLLGVYADQTLAGVRVIEHNETPGLGDKIELRKSDWMLQFKGLSLANTPSEQWKVTKDGGQFDAFTGATITPRAVLAAINKALLFSQQEASKLFDDNNLCGGNNDRSS